jgi:hypothetical protein
MAAVKEMHAEAGQRQKPDEPIADEEVRPMLGDKQEGRHGKKADECYPDRRPPEALRPGMFVVIHELSNSAIAEMTRINTVALESKYGLSVFWRLDLRQRPILVKVPTVRASERTSLSPQSGFPRDG